MKKIFQLLLLPVCIFGLCLLTNAQEANIDQAFKKQSIAGLNELMIDFYVFPDVAQKTADHLNKKLQAGHFDQFNTLEAFAESLTEEVQSINKDKHMRIRPVPPYVAKENTPESMMEERLHRIERSRRGNYGFAEAKKLEGNVGYFDLRGFAGVEKGGPMADSYMHLLSTSDAIIVDLRKNGGGSPAMVQYLCSYFFDEKVHLNSLYWREGDHTQEYWTLDEVGGKKMPDVPLFVLTSSRTFSGAEEFSYNMQTQKRATLVGETTGGGANPGGTRNINKKLMVFIPTGRAINPITKTNWEGVGVVPEVKTTSEEALDKAHELAKIAATNYRSQSKEKYRAVFADLQNNIHHYNGTDEKIINSIKKCHKVGLLDEGTINGMGYDFLLQHKKPKVAEVIFKTNTILFPQSANVYDSYGEALAMNGQMKASVHNYKKAVELAEANEDSNLELFKENLKKAEAKMKKVKP
ncbi:MAG: S41 family peptidase [Bacteroidota bacterium]